MTKSTWFRLGLAALLVSAAWRTFFVVDEAEYAVVTRFGRPVREIKEAGPYVKCPWDQVWRLDNRLRVYSPGPVPMLTQDKKMLQVDAYVCWRVAEPTVYVKTMRADETMAKRRLLDAVRSELSAELGNVELSNVISTEAESLKLGEVTDTVTSACADVARRDLGVEIRDVGIQRLVFPEQNLESVFARMRAERQRIAKKYRAEGEQEAERIKAGADKEKERILSEAYRTAERTKGEGEAEAARTYAAAHSADPRFYRLVRTLQAYEKMFGKDTTVVLSADSELLELMTEGREGLE